MRHASKHTFRRPILNLLEIGAIHALDLSILAPHNVGSLDAAAAELSLVNVAHDCSGGVACRIATGDLMLLVLGDGVLFEGLLLNRNMTWSQVAPVIYCSKSLRTMRFFTTRGMNQRNCLEQRAPIFVYPSRLLSLHGG